MRAAFITRHVVFASLLSVAASPLAAALGAAENGEGNDHGVTAIHFRFRIAAGIDAQNTLVVPRPPREAVLVFECIPGGLCGATTQEFLATVKVGDDGVGRLDLSDRLFTEKTQPDVLADNEWNKGLTIEPADTKLARIGTFWYLFWEFGGETANMSLPGTCGFVDDGTKKDFVIAYFSQPCTLRGVIQTREANGLATAHLDVTVESAGFHCLEWAQVDAKTYKVTQILLPEHPVFRVQFR